MHLGLIFFRLFFLLSGSLFWSRTLQLICFLFVSDNLNFYVIRIRSTRKAYLMNRRNKVTCWGDNNEVVRSGRSVDGDQRRFLSCSNNVRQQSWWQCGMEWKLLTRSSFSWISKNPRRVERGRMFINDCANDFPTVSSKGQFSCIIEMRGSITRRPEFNREKAAK